MIAAPPPIAPVPDTALPTATETESATYTGFMGSWTMRRGFTDADGAEDEDGLAPAKDDNDAWRRADRRDCRILAAA